MTHDVAVRIDWQLFYRYMFFKSKISKFLTNLHFVIKRIYRSFYEFICFFISIGPINWKPKLKDFFFKKNKMYKKFWGHNLILHIVILQSYLQCYDCHKCSLLKILNKHHHTKKNMVKKHARGGHARFQRTIWKTSP